MTLVLIVHILYTIVCGEEYGFIQTKKEILCIKTRYNKNLNLPMAILTAFQKGAYFFLGIKLFNHLPINIKTLSKETKLLNHALNRFLLLHLFYSIEMYFNYDNK